MTHAWKTSNSVYLMGAIVALTLFGDSLLYSVLPLYAGDLGIPLVAVGVILSANRWVRLATNPLSAKVYHKYGLHRPLLAAVSLGLVATFIYAHPWGFVVFLLARVLWGLCWSHLRLGSFLVILGTASDRIGVSMGTYHAITRLGSAFTVLIGGLLIDSFGYRLGFVTMAALSTLAIPLVFGLRSLLKNDRVGLDIISPQSSPGQQKGRAPELSLNLCNYAAFVTSFVGAGIIVSSLSLILNQRIGSSVMIGSTTIGIATISGLLFALRWTSNLLFSPIAGRLSDIFGRRKMFLFLTSITACLLTAFGYVVNPLITVLLACLLFFSGNSLEVILDAAISDLANLGDSTEQVSRYASYYDLGGASGPIIGYYLGTRFGFAVPYYVGAGIIIILLMGCFLESFSRPKQQPLAG